VFVPLLSLRVNTSSMLSPVSRFDVGVPPPVVRKNLKIAVSLDRQAQSGIKRRAVRPVKEWLSAT
jgi:hypothetical protein